MTAKNEFPIHPSTNSTYTLRAVEAMYAEIDRLRTHNEILLRIADRLDREAKHWQEHPDYWTPRRDFFQNTDLKTAYAEVKAYLADRVFFHRATHTDIVLRDLAAQLRRLAK